MGGPTFSWWMILLAPLMVLMKIFAPVIRLCSKFWYVSIPLIFAAIFFAGKYLG